MDPKKFTFSDQFPNCLSPSRKLLSGFGFGVVTSLVIFILVFFSIPSKAPPLFNPIFQGFNTFSPNTTTTTTTSLIPWPFSFSTTTPPSSSSSTNSSSTSTKLQKPVDLTQTRETHNANVSLIGTNGEFTNYTGKSVNLEETHLANSLENVKNGSTQGSSSGNESSLGNSVGPTEYFNSSVWQKSGKEERVRISVVQSNMTISRNESEVVRVGKSSCDIFDGRWVRDETKPYYPAGSCLFIDRDFNCHLNGRPDDGFLKWKWQPYGCHMPSLNATDFLERLRGKKLVFVGDSLNRNMWESLVCVLRHSIRNKKRVYEISGRREFKKKGFYAFRFEDYNCSVDFVSSPFLVRESSFKGRNGTLETLRLDLMDRTTKMYRDADAVVFNTGHWWTHEKTSRGEDYYQEGNHVYPRLEVLEAYKRALNTWARWVDKNVDRSRTQVIFRGYSVTHFRGGQWNSGGQCHKEAEPIFNTTHLAEYPSKMITLENVLREMKTGVIYLNISRLTDYRKDGHPSIYRMKYRTIDEQMAAEHSQDCSHWCLPGVPDTWNELLYASLLKVGKGSWRG